MPLVRAVWLYSNLSVLRLANKEVSYRLLLLLLVRLVPYFTKNAKKEIHFKSKIDRLRARSWAGAENSRGWKSRNSCQYPSPSLVARSLSVVSTVHISKGEDDQVTDFYLIKTRCVVVLNLFLCLRYFYFCYCCNFFG